MGKGMVLGKSPTLKMNIQFYNFQADDISDFILRHLFWTSIQIPSVNMREHNFLYYYLVVAIERTKIFVLELDTVPDTHTFP